MDHPNIGRIRLQQAIWRGLITCIAGFFLALVSCDVVEPTALCGQLE